MADKIPCHTSRPLACSSTIGELPFGPSVRSLITALLLLAIHPSRCASVQMTPPHLQTRHWIDSVFARWCDTTLRDYEREVNLSFVFYADSSITVEQAAWLQWSGKRIGMPDRAYRSELANAWFAKGISWGNYPNGLDSGLACFQRAGHVLAGLGLPEAGPLPKCFSADLYLNYGRLTDAVLTMQPAVQEYVLQGDTAQAVDALWTIAMALAQQGNHATAANEYRRILGWLSKSRAYRRFAVLCQLADVEMDAGNMDSALASIRAAEGMIERKEFRDYGLFIPAVKARVLLLRGECEQAYAIYAPVLDSIRNTPRLIARLATAELDLARAASCLGRAREVISLTTSSLERSDVPLAINERLLCYKLLSDAHKSLGHEREALGYLERCMGLKDSIAGQASMIAANNAVLMAEFDRQQIADSLRATAIQALAKSAITRARSQRIALIIGTLLIAIIAALLLNRSRLKRRIQVEQLRTRLSRDLHDDIGSTLSSINILTSVARKKAEAGDASGAATSLAGISERSQRLQRSMSDIVWSVDPDKDAMDDLTTRMREFGASVLEPKDITFSLEVGADLPASLSPEFKSNIYLIFKEAVNNAAKHAQATRVDVRIRKEEGALRMTVADNGKGIAPDKSDANGGGNGLRNMRERALRMNAELRTTRVIPHGTRIELEVKV